MSTAIIQDVSAPRAALALIAAGHMDAAADVLIACERTGATTVTLTAYGRELRVTVGAA
jgi:hypothetical protein